MRTIEVNLYQFDELTEHAKERAREWYRQGTLDFEWWADCYEMAKEVGAHLGITIDKIYFSGFCSQGDGACFEGSYQYNPKWKTSLDLPSDEIVDIGGSLLKAQVCYREPILVTIKQRPWSRYTHEQTMGFEFETASGGEVDQTTRDGIIRALRSFARWVYRLLESHYYYLMSDECVDESIAVNEYEFTEDGEVS